MIKQKKTWSYNRKSALFHIIEQRVTGCGVVNGGDPGQLAIDKVLERQERLDFSVKLRLFPL